jgi:hypothetical protein
MARKSSAAMASARADFAAAIAERAYFKALSRGFAPGHELEDWLAAERELQQSAETAPTVTTPKRGASPRKSASRKRLE